MLHPEKGKYQNDAQTQCFVSGSFIEDLIITEEQKVQNKQIQIGTGTDKHTFKSSNSNFH